MVSGPSISTPVNVSNSSSPMSTLEKTGSARQSPALDKTQSGMWCSSDISYTTLLLCVVHSHTTTPFDAPGKQAF